LPSTTAGLADGVVDQAAQRLGTRFSPMSARLYSWSTMLDSLMPPSILLAFGRHLQ